MNTPLKKLLPILVLILTHSVYGQIQSPPSSIELQIQTLEQKQDSLRYVMSKIEVESALEALNSQYQNEGIESPESVQKLKRLIAELERTLENHRQNWVFDPLNGIVSSTSSEQMTINNVFKIWDLPVVFDEEAVKRDLLSKGNSIQGNEDITVKLFLIDNYLVASYHYKDVVDFDTKVIDLDSKKEVWLQNNTKFYVVERLDKSSKYLIVSTEGYDNMGHFWQSGFLNLEKLQLTFNQKEH